MSDSTNAVLQRAYELIEQDELEQAQAILTPLLESDSDNPSLWWVYTHSHRDRAIGLLALDRVLELDPAYPGASDLKADVVEIQERDEEFAGLDVVTDGIAQVAETSGIDDWEDLQPVVETDTDSQGGRRGFVFLVVILLIIASGAALLASGAVDLSELLEGILSSPEPQIIVVSEPTDEPEATETVAAASATESEREATPVSSETPASAVVAESTSQAATAEDLTQETAEPSPKSTADATLVQEAAEASPEASATAASSEEPSQAPDPTETPLEILIGDLGSTINEFEILQESSGTEDTPMGNTLVIQLCAIPGREFNERLNRVMNAVVEKAEEIPEDIEAVAAGLVNCDDPDANLRLIGVAVSVIMDFANEEIDAKDFQRAWQPLS